MKFIRTLLLTGLVIAFGFTYHFQTAQADGGIFHPLNYYSAETSQKAFIYYANQTENMVVLTTFQGNAKDFVWVVPTPSQPTVSKGNVALFNRLAAITKINNNGPDIIYNVGLEFGAATKSSPVDVISEKTVGEYDTAVLKATDETALTKWLTDHGYAFPAGQSSNLKSYVDNGWFFAIAKVRSDLVADDNTRLPTGTLTPLQLTFQTNQIIYPMKLTGIALSLNEPPVTATPPLDSPITQQVPISPAKIPITLYVLSSGKTTQNLLTTDWANWISTSDVESLNTNLDSKLTSGSKIFLTQMSGSLSVAEMTDDFIIQAAADNTVYPTPAYKTSGFWLSNILYLIIAPLVIIFTPFPFGLLFIVFLLLQKYIKKKWLYVIGSVYEIGVCLMLLLAGLFIMLTASPNLASLVSQNGFLGATISAIALLVLGIYATIKMLKHYHKIFAPKT